MPLRSSGSLIAAFSIAQLAVRAALGPGLRPLRAAARAPDRAHRLGGRVRGLRARRRLWLLFLSRLVQGAGGGTTGVAQAYVADTCRPKTGPRRSAGFPRPRRRASRSGPAIGSLRRPPGPGGARPRGGGALPAQRRVRLALAAGVAAAATAGPARPTAADLAPRLDRRCAIRRAGLPAALDLRHRHAGVRVHMTSVLALYLGREFGLDERTIGPIFTYIGMLSLVMRSVLLGPDRGPPGGAWTMRLGAAAAGARPPALPQPHRSGRSRPSSPLCRSAPRCCFHPLPRSCPAHSDPARAGHDDGRGPDLRRAGPGGGAAARDRRRSSGWVTAAVLPRAAPAWRSPACSPFRCPSASRASPRSRRRRKQRRVRMSTDERLERLERRHGGAGDAGEELAAAGRAATGRAAQPGAPDARSVAQSPRPAAPPPIASRRSPQLPAPAPPLAAPARPAAVRPPAITGFTEQWIGQRGLLAIGVVALLMATGYLLKLSFDRGWISPVMRCTGGVVLGGDRRRRDRLAAASALSHLRRGAHRLRRRHHLPQRVGGLPALRGHAADHRHRGAGAGVRRARHGRVRDQRRGARHHRRARRLHGAGAAGPATRPTPTCSCCTSPAWPRGSGWSPPGSAGG